MGGCGGRCVSGEVGRRLGDEMGWGVDMRGDGGSGSGGSGGRVAAQRETLPQWDPPLRVFST